MADCVDCLLQSGTNKCLLCSAVIRASGLTPLARVFDSGDDFRQSAQVTGSHLSGPVRAIARKPISSAPPAARRSFTRLSCSFRQVWLAPRNGMSDPTGALLSLSVNPGDRPMAKTVRKAKKKTAPTAKKATVRKQAAVKGCGK